MYDEDNHKRADSRRHGGIDTPKNSRLFVIGNKDHTEAVLREHFNQFGTVEDVWMVRDKRTGEKKGVGYVKFAKASQAALAMEASDGKPVGNTNRSIKVKIAQSRESGSTRDFNEDEELTRLFIVVPKSYEDGDIRPSFEGYGEITRITVIKDRNSGDNKGFAYVKFAKVSHAALAIENCEADFKAVFAQPKYKPEDRRDERRDDRRGRGNSRDFERPGRSYDYRDRDGFDSGPSRGFEVELRRGANFLDTYSGYSHPAMSIPGSSRLQVEVLGKVTEQQLHALFDIIPGLEYCDFRSDSTTWNFRGTAHVRYNSVQSAAFAKQKLHGFEYPPGCPLSVAYADGGGGGGGVGSLRQEPLMRGAPGGPGVFQFTNTANTGRDSFTCSVALPPPQLLAPADSPVIERLFVILTRPLNEQVVQDVFSRFGNLISYYNIKDRNYGYAKYADKDSAMKAMETLYGQEICGERLKVVVADPEEERVSKRPRVD